MINQRAEPDLMRVIVFAIGPHLFALPMKVVVKISPRPPELHPDFDDVGLLDLEGEMVRLLRLEPLLALNAPTERPFLILVRTPQGLGGIQVTELPNMMELPMATIQPLPDASTMLRRLSQYVALWHLGDGQQPIFLLDLALTFDQLALKGA